MNVSDANRYLIAGITPEGMNELEASQASMSLINEMREAIRVYGGHIPNCAGRPCTCGFQSIWEKFV